jgi:uncharacterized protein YcsI (UPF0317 family)
MTPAAFLSHTDATAARQAWAAYRAGHVAPTPGIAPGFTQANMIVPPRDWAFDFLLSAQRNPKPCPRPISGRRVADAATISGRFPAVHGAPVHVGMPEAIGIADLAQPDFGEAVRIEPGEVPVFWACGVTPQAVVMASELPFVITHAAGHMLITDIPDAAYHA